MPPNATPNSTEAEQSELYALVEVLARSPRLANLLRYIGDKYFSGERDHLTEYNIATEVFGRSKTIFDSGEDAIARVEAHRLRKRLKEYYENDGSDHAIQVSLPAGSYAPLFTPRSSVKEAEAPSVSQNRVVEPEGMKALENEADDSEAQKPPATLETPQIRASGSAASPSKPIRGRLWILGAIAASVVVVIVAASIWGSRAANDARKSPGAQAAAPVPASMPGKAKVPLRIMAGYTGPSQIDSAGDTWQADQYFDRGGNWHKVDMPVSRTSDPLLFKQWRTGDFQYNIPLAPGVYELHLYFESLEQSADSWSTFSVSINGASVLTGFDVNSDAMGANIADERIFRDVSPSKDGWLYIGFTSERGAPMLNALEVLPGIPHRQLPIRIVTQPVAFRDHTGNVWHPDTYYMNGHPGPETHSVTGTPDPDLFGSERYGHFNYAIPVDPRDRYTLVLHFAEFYFGPQASADGGVGSRVFRVLCNGDTLLDNFDIYKEAGALHAVVKTFQHLKPTAQGKLNLTFEPIANNATVSGIEVLDESQ